MITKKVFRFLKNTFLTFLITFTLLELTLAVYIRMAKIKIELPTYSFQNTHRFWFDLNKDFGTLHLPNDTYRQKKYCFDVVYNTNSQGFRDKERSQKSHTNRVVALGDSFTEGIGVEVQNRLTNLLENNKKIPHLNFGIAGNFGPAQYAILYQKLASKYTHEAVLIGVLPANDFIDDDYEISLKVGGDRYRPFFVGSYPNYKTIYHADSIHKSKAKPQKQNFRHKLLKNFTHSYNFYHYIKVLQKIKTIPKDKLLAPKKVPSYFNFSNEQFRRMQYAIELIKKEAGKRPVMLYTIPIYKEIVAYREYGKNPLGKKLQEVCNNAGVAYLDLLPLTSNLSLQECEDLFLSCDGHWSNKGNEFAKKHIISNFSYYKK